MMSALVGVGIFLFWFIAYPHALSYQEQYQLFLWTGDYFAEHVTIPGGLAGWLGEFIVQFYYIEWLGALLLALLFVALQLVTAHLLPTCCPKGGGGLAWCRYCCCGGSWEISMCCYRCLWPLCWRWRWLV